MIKKNTTVPVSKTQTFSTAADNQPSVEIHVLQGERAMAHDNKTLGRFILDGIPPAPRGIPQVEVTLDIDANGILNVKAKDKGTGKEQSVRIEGSSGLTDEEKKRMTADAEKHATEDAKRKELAETKNLTETLIYTTEKMVSENGDKIKEEDKKEISDKAQAAKEAIKSEDLEKTKKASDELSKIAQRVGTEIYKQAADKPKEEVKPEEKKNEGN